MATRKKRSDSAAAAIDAMANATKIIDPPKHVKLRDGDRPFWDAVVRARDYSSWNESDLIQAGNLARCMSDIERLQMELDKEGDVVTNQRGTQIVNPKHSLLETLSRRSVSLSRIIQVHAQATQGESKQQRGRNTKQREAQQFHESEDDELIARPVH